MPACSMCVLALPMTCMHEQYAWVRCPTIVPCHKGAPLTRLRSRKTPPASCARSTPATEHAKAGMQGQERGCTVPDASTIAVCRRCREALAMRCTQKPEPQFPARTRHGPACALPTTEQDKAHIAARVTSATATLNTRKGPHAALLNPSMQGAQPVPQLTLQPAARGHYGQAASFCRRPPHGHCGSRQALCWRQPSLSPADTSLGPTRGGGALSAAAAASAATR